MFQDGREYECGAERQGPSKELKIGQDRYKCVIKSFGEAEREGDGIREHSRARAG